MMQPEQFSSSPSPIDTVTYEEIFAYSDVIEDVRKLQTTIEHYANTADIVDEDVLSEQLEQLDELMGLQSHQEDVASRYTGYLYPYDDFGLITNEGVVVYDAEVRFGGSRCIDVADEQAVIFAVEWDDGNECKEYGVPLEAMLRLDVARDSLATILRQHTLAAELAVSSDAFLQSSRHRQVAEMQAVTQGCFEDIEPFADEQQCISLAGDAYIRYDETAEQAFDVVRYESPDGYVTGALDGVSYIETQYHDKHTFRRFDEFQHDGAPCVVVRCDDMQATVYLPLGGITAYRQLQ